jgi:glutamine synthetase
MHPSCVLSRNAARIPAKDSDDVPRSGLAEIVNSTKSQHDLDFFFGMEIEFYIMDESSGRPQPVKMVHANWSTASLNNKYVLVVEEIVRAIINVGIPVRQ